MRSERFADFLYRYRWVLFGIWWIHVFIFHYRILGFFSWDGFGHRGFPIVELAQHGEMAKWKYNEWSIVGYTPFIELAHIPFLLVFGLKGFIIGFPLVVFPLCVTAVYLLVRELTSDKRAATFGAFAYSALPMVNQQPFSGYIDFAVSGILAFFLYALVRVRASDRPLAPYVRLVIATFMFTMARSQGPYVVVVLFPLIAYALFCEREGRRIRVVMRRRLLLAAAAVAIGAAPAIALQISKYFEYGSPIAPMQFQFLGVTIGDGVTLDQYFKYAGLGGGDLKSLAEGFFEGWIWHKGWPIGAFYASRYLAAGFLFVLAVVLSPVFFRRATRLELWILGAGVLVSLLSRDFGVPRWGYTTVIAICVVTGRAMSALASSERGRPLFWGACAVLFVHLLRPEVDYLQLRQRDKYVSPRLNMTGSKSWIKGRWDVTPFPDGPYRFFILEVPGNNFVLQIFGPSLSNEVLGTILKEKIGPHCEGLAPYAAEAPDALFIDDLDLTKDCSRECAIQKNYCLAYRIAPGKVPAPPVSPPVPVPVPR